MSILYTIIYVAFIRPPRQDVIQRVSKSKYPSALLHQYGVAFFPANNRDQRRYVLLRYNLSNSWISERKHHGINSDRFDPVPGFSGISAHDRSRRTPFSAYCRWNRHVRQLLRNGRVLFHDDQRCRVVPWYRDFMVSGHKHCRIHRWFCNGMGSLYLADNE